jgi:hypothetical protein
MHVLITFGTPSYKKLFFPVIVGVQTKHVYRGRCTDEKGGTGNIYLILMRRTSTGDKWMTVDGRKL